MTETASKQDFRPGSRTDGLAPISIAARSHTHNIPTDPRVEADHLRARGRLDADGRLLIVSQKTRSQPQNLADAREKLVTLVRLALIALAGYCAEEIAPGRAGAALGRQGPDNGQHVQFEIGPVVDEGLNLASDGEHGCWLGLPPCGFPQLALEKQLRFLLKRLAEILVEIREAPLILGDQLGIKGAQPIARNIQRQCR